MLCFRIDQDSILINMRIRMAKEMDLGAAAQLWFERIALLRESDANTVLLPDAIYVWQQQAKHWIDDDGYAFFIAESDGKLAGILVVSIKDNVPWLYPPRLGEIVEMVLDLHRPHSRLAGALLERAAAWFRANDLAILEVQPPAHYPVEETFWRAQGGNSRSHKFWLKL